MRAGLPARVEQHKNGTNVMLGGDGEEDVQPILEALPILSPELS
jgi:hypothetical protein